MLAGSGLLIGMAIAYITKPAHRSIARLMAFGAGSLLGTVSIQLVLSAQAKAGTARTMLVLLSGALLFSIMNAQLARAGARNRKRCGECMAQDNERDHPGSGNAIAIGTMIDTLPEGLVLGIAVGQSAAPFPLIAGVFLANVPESVSSSVGMRHAGRSTRYILAIWTTAVVVNLVVAGFAAAFFAAASPMMTGILEALSGGILLAMAVETMIPEAFDKAPLFSGTIAVLGFAFVAVIAALLLPH